MKVGNMVRRIRSLHPFSDEEELVEVGVVIEVEDEENRSTIKYTDVVVMVLWGTGLHWHDQRALEVIDASR